MKTKKFWKSKIFWTNAIGIAAFIVQAKTGFVVDPALQGVALGAINGALRCVTNEAIEW